MSNDMFSANHKLAAVMQDLGYTSTADESAFRTVLRQLTDIKEKDVAEAMAMMARTRTGLSDHLGLHAALFLVSSSGGSGGPGSQGLSGESGLPTTWSPNLFVDVLKATRPQLSWQRVGEQLDHEGFLVTDAQGFAMLNSMFARALGERQMPLSMMVGRLWANTAGQVSLLQYAIAAPPEVFTFEGSEHRQAPMEALVLMNRSPIGSPNQAWLSLDLVQRLCQLGEAGHLVAVRGLLEGPATGCPELLLTATAAVHTEYQLLQREVFAALLPMVLRGSTRAASAVMARLWAVNKPLVVEALVEYFGQDCINIQRVLDMCTELGVLHTVLDSTPYPFCLELAILASRLNQLNLESWLGDHLARDSVHLVAEVLRYVDAQTYAFQHPENPGENILPVQIDALRALMQLLSTAAPMLPAELLADVQRVTASAAKVFPSLASTIGSGQEPFAPDVEDEANRTFQSIYSETQPMSDVVTMLAAFKNSEVPREQAVFKCMIHNLFDEYRFFPRYPDRELLITAQLFGALVRHQLVSSIPLGIALRYILEALKKPSPSKMFSFGLDALRQFASTVSQWPQFCAAVVQLPHLREADPALFARLEAATHQQQAVRVASSVSSDGGGGGRGARSMAQPPHRQMQATQQSANSLSLASLLLDPPQANTTNNNTNTISRGPSGSVTSAGTAAPGGAAAQAAAAAAAAATSRGSSSSNASDPVHMAPHANAVGPTPIGGAFSGSAIHQPLQGAQAPGSNNNNNNLAFGSMNNPFLSTPISSNTPSAHAMSGLGGGSTGLANLSISSLGGATSAAAQQGGSAAAAAAAAGALSSQVGNAAAAAALAFNTLANQQQQQQSSVARQAAAVPATAGSTASLAAGKMAFAASGADNGAPSSNGGPPGGFSIGGGPPNAGMRAGQQFDKTMSMDEGDRLDKEGSASLAAQVAASSLLANDKPSLASLINTESLETAAEKFCAGFEAPPELVADRIHFMMNNVSALNIDVKAIEIRDKIYPQYADWFANYIVVKRAAQEANFHSLYITLLDKMDLKDLMRQTVRTTFYFVKVLLYSERILKESNDRALLKNLGVWLGLLTFAKNKPVMGKELELKAIITEAYQRGRLIAVLPFIQKLLDCCKDSLVFKPSNPMIAGILSMLAELHAMKGLKINNAFSIELVFKAFGLSPHDVQPSDTLKCLTRESLQNPDWGVDALPPQQPQQQQQQQQPPSRSQSTPDGKANVEQQMLDQVVSVVVNDNLDLGCTLIERAATEKAVRDIDKSLAAAFQERAKARAAGKPFVDASPFHGRCALLRHVAMPLACLLCRSSHLVWFGPLVVDSPFTPAACLPACPPPGRFPASLPESLAPRPGSVAGLQLKVYEDFKNIQRTAAPPPGPALGGGLEGSRPGFPGDGCSDGSSVAAQALLVKYKMWQSLVDASVASATARDQAAVTGAPPAPGPDPQVELQALLGQLEPMVLSTAGYEGEAGVMLAKRVMKHLYDGSSKTHLMFHGACLELLAKIVGKRVPLELTALFAAAEDERKYSKEVADQLLPRRLLSLPELDSYLSKALSSQSRSSAVADYAMHLLQQTCSREPVITYGDVYRTLEALLTLMAGTPSHALVSSNDAPVPHEALKPAVSPPAHDAHTRPARRSLLIGPVRRTLSRPTNTRVTSSILRTGTVLPRRRSGLDSLTPGCARCVGPGMS
ncbi:MAG: hypothetical protein WDW38_010962 [Sanguina aurantia]